MKSVIKGNIGNAGKDYSVIITIEALLFVSVFSKAKRHLKDFLVDL